MKLDRYSGQPFKFQVLRRVDGEHLANCDQGALRYDELLIEGVRYRLIDPSDCFVLKRPDIHADEALGAYAHHALECGPSHRDTELAGDVQRLRDDWAVRTNERADLKSPD